MKFRVLHGCIAVSILVTLNARWLLPHQREIIYILKPLTVLLMVALAMLSTGANSRYRKLITAGLCCSLAGDICLMLPANLFLPGLILFFCAHVFYLSAFMVDRGPVKQKGVLLLLLPAVMILPVIWPGIPPVLIVPVLGYLVIITVMTMQAVGRGLAINNKSGWLAAAGAVLFFCSDAFLAINRFGVRLPSAGLLVLGAYYPAQWLIASSVRYFVPGKNDTP